MEKQLKDYLPLLIGCEGELTTKRTYGSPKRTTQILTPELLDRLYKLPTVLAFKPALRPVSDMTEEEKSKYYSIPNTIGYQYEAERTLFLLLNFFDLFGLIEAGSAISKPK